MSKDARISTTFKHHPKRVKLQRRLGAAGVLAFVDLVLFATDVKPDGSFGGMTSEDIAIACGWAGDPEELVATLLDIGFLDRSEHGEFSMHDWCEHNPFVAKFNERQHLARVNSHVGWLKRKGTTCKQKGCELCRSHKSALRISRNGNAPSPSPSPSPSLKAVGASAKPRRTPHELPEDWTPSPADLVWVSENHPRAAVAAETERFKNHHIGKGTKWKDWSRAWRNWISRAFVDGPQARIAPPAPKKKDWADTEAAQLFQEDK